VPVPQLAAVLGVPGLPLAPVMHQPSATQQATRHARRIYLGGLPPTVDEARLGVLFNQALTSIGGLTAPGEPVVNVFINQEKKFSFVEFRSVEETSNAMALDGCVPNGPLSLCC
jgi:splicing factor U2AF subunit